MGHCGWKDVSIRCAPGDSVLYPSLSRGERGSGGALYLD